MKNTQKMAVLVSTIVFLTAMSILLSISSNSHNVTESDAISLLKKTYPEFKNYPNDNLPPQSIQTKQTSKGWYVAFVQEGSGRPILEAKCFFVNNDKTITVIGVYAPKVDEDSLYDLSGEKIFDLWLK